MNDPSIPRDGPGQALAGLIAAASIFVSLVALVDRPLRIAPASLVIALLAVGFGGRHSRLAAAAVAVATVCFVAGMTIAVLRSAPLF